LIVFGTWAVDHLYWAFAPPPKEPWVIYTVDALFLFCAVGPAWKGLRMTVKGIAGPATLTGETPHGDARTAPERKVAEYERGGGLDPIHTKRF